MSMMVYDFRSNCAAGVLPLWQPMQYFMTNGRTSDRTAAAAWEAPRPKRTHWQIPALLKRLEHSLQSPLFHQFAPAPCVISNSSSSHLLLFGAVAFICAAICGRTLCGHVRLFWAMVYASGPPV